MALPRELALTAEELDELMLSTWVMRIASVGPGTRIHVTPMWFGWAGGRIYLTGRGQKVVNLRRNPECTVIVDRNERFPELQAAMFQGRASVLEDAAAEEADPHLEEARWQMGTKYYGGHGERAAPLPPGERVRNDATARGRNRRWIVVQPERVVTWDNFKLDRVRAGG